MLRRQRAGALQRPESSFRRRGSRFRRRTACAGPQAAQAAACIAGQNAPSAKCLAAEPRSRNRRKTRCNKTDPPSPSMLYLRRWLGRRLGSASVPPHIPDVATAKAANRFPSVERQKTSLLSMVCTYRAALRQEPAQSGGCPTPLCRWISRATRRINGSSKRGATICIPMGSPSCDRPAGALAAGKLTSVIR